MYNKNSDIALEHLTNGSLLYGVVDIFLGREVDVILVGF